MIGLHLDVLFGEIEVAKYGKRGKYGFMVYNLIYTCVLCGFMVYYHILG